MDLKNANDIVKKAVTLLEELTATKAPFVQESLDELSAFAYDNIGNEEIGILHASGIVFSAAYILPKEFPKHIKTLYLYSKIFENPSFMRFYARGLYLFSKNIDRENAYKFILILEKLEKENRPNKDIAKYYAKALHEVDRAYNTKEIFAYEESFRDLYDTYPMERKIVEVYMNILADCICISDEFEYFSYMEKFENFVKEHDDDYEVLLEHIRLLWTVAASLDAADCEDAVKIIEGYKDKFKHGNTSKENSDEYLEIYLKMLSYLAYLQEIFDTQETLAKVEKIIFEHGDKEEYITIYGEILSSILERQDVPDAENTLDSLKNLIKVYPDIKYLKTLYLEGKSYINKMFDV